MRESWKSFISYAVIGIANTLIHWQLFYLIRSESGVSQAVSNFVAFCAAAPFSFYANALFTFSVPASPKRYLLFILCMGSISLVVGGVSDHFHLPGLITVVTFSLTSLLIGYTLSRYWIFRP